MQIIPRHDIEVLHQCERLMMLESDPASGLKSVIGIFWGVRCNEAYRVPVFLRNYSVLYTIKHLDVSSWVRRKKSVVADRHINRRTISSNDGLSFTLYFKEGSTHNHLISKLHPRQYCMGNILMVMHSALTSEPLSIPADLVDSVTEIMLKYVLSIPSEANHKFEGESRLDMPILSVSPDLFNSFNSGNFDDFLSKFDKLQVEHVPLLAPRVNRYILMLKTSECPSAYQVFFCPELLEQILYRADLCSLTVLHEVSRYSCDCMQGMMRRRMRELLSLFLPPEHIQPFLTLLDYTQSSIGGSFATCLLMWEKGWNPMNLNLFVPSTMHLCWSRFFAACPEKKTKVKKWTPSTINRGTSLVEEIWTLGAGYRQIHISEGDYSSVLGRAWDYRSSADLNMVTATLIFCPYPVLTMQYKALAKNPEGVHPGYVLDMEDKNVQILLNTGGFNKPCQYICLTIDRKFKYLRGFAKLTFYENMNNILSQPQESVDVTTSSFLWRLGDECHNQHCHNSWRFNDVPVLQPLVLYFPSQAT
ncbi:uncharacterized protein EV420DRAFT_1645667 [Desarmillaria tabescens]|uniref:Uncharacterized protein n=1 Tax=Armillaria tabescens TaxID=1929756 RepID=A0AA39K438_ARMTA|nr:uncharacterized protein EV420DRAFT_1645667 [Desarmillaria tabescens]KAK0452814.1 hypothetical protein EV420DRAFT_1645667 [Desarmillaria tabescens]